MISKGNHVKVVHFVLLAISEEAKNMTSIFISVQCIIKTVVGFGFCDIQNNQGLGEGYRAGKGYQAKWKASADNPYLDLDYFWISRKASSSNCLLLTMNT